MKSFKHLILAALPLALLGCATLEQASSGHVGCPANEIIITNHERGWNTSTWTASCRGKDFVCSSVSGGKDSVQVACKEAAASSLPLEPGAPSAAPTSGGEAPAAGCAYDTQCKGDRICRAGQCVDPAPAAVPAPSQPATPAAPEAPPQS